MSISNQWEIEILDHIFNNAAAPAVAALTLGINGWEEEDRGSN